MEVDFRELMELKYCVRTKHSIDLSLKRPRMNCVFLEGKECSIHLAHSRYLKSNLIKEVRPVMRFRCVLFNSDGMSVAEQRDYDRASASIQREEMSGVN